MKNAEPSLPIMQRLRAETRLQHESIEASVDIMGSFASFDAYLHILNKFLGFYLGLARQTWNNVDAINSRIAWLKQDFEALQQDFDIPAIENVPLFPSEAAQLGCLYVIEGSGLGAQIIARRLQETLQLNRDNGARFFYGNGPETGAKWRAFGAHLNAVVTTEQDQEIAITAARATFTALETWMKA